ncbi:MAG TPA: hypothetical protein VMS95_01520 [Candidatus Krumholzibacteriaceae bacterium]|nr:hypothetical protein [Candidatus Krumholzibacteriaceae bacterium]
MYTEKEVEQARAYVKQGWKHRLRIKGSLEFKQKVKEILYLIKTAGYDDFLRTYIRDIVEIEGFSQLREAEVALWANKELLQDPVDAAGFFVQKAQQMKDFLEDKPYYGGPGEISAVNKRLEFLEKLKSKSKEPKVKQRCEEILKDYAESTFF